MKLRPVLAALFFCGAATVALAAEPPKQPERQTSWGLYVDAKEAYQMKTSPEGKNMLLVDVRDPVEPLAKPSCDLC